jgi:hypothetical protein
MAGGNVAPRPRMKPFAISASSALPEPGTTEHAMLILLMLELVALIMLRRYFRGAHGG